MHAIDSIALIYAHDNLNDDHDIPGVQESGRCITIRDKSRCECN